MSDLSDLGRILIFLGAALFVIGALILWGPKIPGLGFLGRLPGDVRIERNNVSLYIPITTSLLISLLLTLLIWLFTRR
ncbi:MAG TPA: DUF2905 domain-containing protein [Nitrospiria bacterium]